VEACQGSRPLQPLWRVQNALAKVGACGGCRVASRAGRRSHDVAAGRVHCDAARRYPLTPATRTDSCRKETGEIGVLSVLGGTARVMPRRMPKTESLRSASGVPLTRRWRSGSRWTRSRTKSSACCSMLARRARRSITRWMNANLDQRAAERSYGIPDEQLTPALSWSKQGGFTAWAYARGWNAEFLPVSIERTADTFSNE
jgi:hypothetical protein